MIFKCFSEGVRVVKSIKILCPLFVILSFVLIITISITSSKGFDVSKGDLSITV